MENGPEVHDQSWDFPLCVSVGLLSVVIYSVMQVPALYLSHREMSPVLLVC